MNGLCKGLLSPPGWTENELKAVEEAKLWISKNSCHKQDCNDYTRKYMKDPSVVHRVTDWITFQSIVTMLGYKLYSDICDNEWYENP
jgi:hypothetical protein